MNREVLDRWCERGILASVLAILFFGPLAFGAVHAWAFLIVQGLAIFSGALWGIRLWLNSRPKILWPPVCWAVVAFAVYAVARYLTADIEYVARHEMIRVLVYALLFLVIVNNLHGQQATQIITVGLVFLAMGISCWAIFQFATKSNHVWNLISPYPNRASGTYICPNHLAGFLEMILPVGLALTLAGRLKAVSKIFIGYASLVIMAGIAVTVSRGGWAAAAAALVILFLLLLTQRGHRIQTLALLVLLVCGSIYFVPKAYERRGHFTQPVTDNYGEDLRFSLWRPTIEMWRDNFWFGVGPGEFDYRFPQYRPEIVQARPDRSHNDFLNTLADWGVVGMSIVAAACALIFLGVVKTWKSFRSAAGDLGKTQSNKFAVMLGASVGLIAIFFHSMVDFNMNIPANAILAVTLMAILTGQLRFTTERHWKTLAVPLKSFATVFLLAGILYLSFENVRGARECAWLQRGNRELTYSKEQIAAFEKAFQIDSKNFDTAWRIGEALRVEAFLANDGYERLAREAMGWFERGMKTNPHDHLNRLSYALCLDLLDKHDEATEYFESAEKLDPNGYFTTAYVGYHFVELGNYAAARSYFRRSRHLQSLNNPIAESYLEIVDRRLEEAASGKKILF